MLYLWIKCSPLKKRLPFFLIAIHSFDLNLTLTWTPSRKSSLTVQVQGLCIFSVWLSCSSGDICGTPSLPFFKPLLVLLMTPLPSYLQHGISLFQSILFAWNPTPSSKETLNNYLLNEWIKRKKDSHLLNVVW